MSGVRESPIIYSFASCACAAAIVMAAEPANGSTNRRNVLPSKTCNILGPSFFCCLDMGWDVASEEKYYYCFRQLQLSLLVQRLQGFLWSKTSSCCAHYSAFCLTRDLCMSFII